MAATRSAKRVIREPRIVVDSRWRGADTKATRRATLVAAVCAALTLTGSPATAQQDGGAPADHGARAAAEATRTATETDTTVLAPWRAMALAPQAALLPGDDGGALATDGGAAADTADDEGVPELRFQSGDFSLDLGGYGSVRYELNEADGVNNSITLRRFVITTDARWSDRLQVFTEVEYERLSEIEVERSVGREEGGLEFEQELEGTNASEIALEQAWGQFNFSREFGIRFGAVLPPVGRFNLNHDDDLWNFPRRPLIDRSANVLPASAAWTEMSLGFVGEANAGGGVQLDYQAYLMNGVGLDFAIEEKVVTRSSARDVMLLESVVSPTQGSFDGSNTADAFAGRFAVSPMLGSEYAVSGYVGEYTPDFLDETETLSTLGFDARQSVGPVELEGEFLWSHFSGLQNVLTDFARTAVNEATATSSGETAALESEIEIALEGLSEDRYGFWIDAGVPIPLSRGFLGLDNPVLTPVVRYEQVWFDNNLEEFDFSGGVVTEQTLTDREQNRLSAGFAFRPLPQTVFHFMYERNDALEGALIAPEDAEGTEDTNAFTFGMAVGF